MAKRLDEIVVGAGIETVDAILDGIARGEHEDGNLVSLALDSRSRLRPSPSGRPRSRIIASYGLSSSVARASTHTATASTDKAGLAERSSKDLGYARFVFDNEETHGSPTLARFAYRRPVDPHLFMSLLSASDLCAEPG